MPDKKLFTLTEADLRLLNSLPESTDWELVWKVLGEKHHFNPEYVEWASSNYDPYIYSEPTE